MNLPQQLANRFREVMLEGQFIANTNFKDQLSQLSWQEANEKTGNLNTIAALTFHVNYYVAGVLQVLEGGALDIRDQYSFDHPPYDSEKAWNNLKNELFSNAERYAVAVSKLHEETLNHDFIDAKYGSYLRNIEAMIEHCYYHLGQVVLLAKMVKGYPLST